MLDPTIPPPRSSSGNVGPDKVALLKNHTVNIVGAFLQAKGVDGLTTISSF
jgi:hypothetical protein